MRWAWLVLFAPLAYGQPSNPQYIQVKTAPSGSCASNAPAEQLIPNGTIYTCQAGTWGTVGGGGSGSVTSVTFTGDGVVDSPTPSTAVTTSGTVAATVKTQTANTVLAGPTTGSAAASTFRALVSADIPNNASNTTGSSASLTVLSGLPSQAADTAVMNATSGSASPTAVAMPTYTTGADLYNTSTHTWSCVSGGGGNTLPFSIIQESTFFYATTGSSSYTFPAALQSSGATAYIFISAGGSVSGTCPTGWTQDINITGGSFDRLMVCHKASAGDTTADLSGIQFLAGYFVELNGSRTIDQSSTGTSSGTGNFIILPSITPTASSMTVAIASVISSSTISLGATLLDPVFNPLWTNIYVQNGAQHFLLGHIYGQTSAASTAIQPPILNFSGLTPLSSGGFAWATFNIK